MKLGKYLSNDRFSLRQVIGMLTLVIVGISVVAYAAVTIPYTFTSGTTAKSSEVNANFTALANAMPAVKVISVADNNTITSAYPTGTQLAALPVTIPAAGNVLISASGTVCIDNHALGSTDELYLKISKTSGAVTGTGSFTSYRIDKAIPTYIDLRSCVPFSARYVFNEATAGTINYYLNMSISTLGGATGEILQTDLAAQYIPNTLP